MERLTPAAVLAVLVAAALCQGRGFVGTPVQERSPAAEGDTFSQEDYAAVLQTFVDPQGLVDYAGLKANQGALEAFVSRLARVNEAHFRSWPAADQIAFWCNAYNALTLKAVVDNYPIQPSFFRSLRFPRNSIRQIPGVWDGLRFEVMGRRLTLDDIEHRILRREYDEPRIHVALVCAAMGCPPLRHEPYRGARLEEQLEDQTRRFLSDPRHFRIDRAAGRVDLSSIFRWYGEDFISRHGTDREFASFDSAERAVLNFLREYLTDEDRRFLETSRLRIGYLDYDWGLNEQPHIGSQP